MKQNLNFGVIVFMLFSMLNLNAKTIAKIPEASGIVYVKKTNSLFVANDEGTIYELTKKGKILRKKFLGKYDLEGITYDKKNDKLLLAVEGDESILIFK